MKARRLLPIRGILLHLTRSTRQYVEAIRTLRKGLKSRGLRAVVWNDSACLWPEFRKNIPLFALKSHILAPAGEDSSSLRSSE